jgi:integrase/recombinase XerD
MARPKAPAGCYWFGDVLYGRIKVKGKRIRWSLHTDNPAIARKAREAGKARAIADRYHGSAPRLFQDVLLEWGPSAKAQLGAKTYERYVCSLSQLDGFLENRKLSEIDGQLIGEIIRERLKVVTLATIKRDLGALSSVMNFAVLEGWCEKNPVLARMKVIKEKRDPIYLPREEDIELVIQHAPGMWPHLIRAAWVTGARQDELVSAKRDQVNHQRKELTVIGKRNQRRVIDLVPFGGYPLFATLPAFVGRDNLFWRSEDKRARSDSKRKPTFVGDKIEDPGPTFKRITRAVEEWAAEHGVEFRTFRFHDLRHKHAVEWLQDGRSIYSLQQRLGHSSVKTTEIYLQFVTGDQKQVAMYGRASG